MARIMTTRAPDELFEKLDEAAKKQGFTRNGLILKILWEWLKEGERDENSRFHKSAEYHWRP